MSWEGDIGFDTFRETDRNNPVNYFPTYAEVYDEGQRVKQNIAQRNVVKNPYQPLQDPTLKIPSRNDPFNTNYLYNSQAPMVPSGQSHTDGEIINRTGLYGEQAGTGQRLVLENSAAARHPWMRLHGNIKRVLASSTSQLEEFASEACDEQRNAAAMHLYQSAIPTFEAMIEGPAGDVAEAFLSCHNLANLIRLMQNALSFHFKIPVLVDPDSSLLNKFVMYAQRNHLARGPSVEHVVGLMNKDFLHQTVPEYITSLNAKDVYERQILRDDRDRTGVAPHPQETRGTRGEQEYDLSVMPLQDPKARHYDAFLKATGLGQGKSNYGMPDAGAFATRYYS